MVDLLIAKGTRVEVEAPQGSAYDGRRGTVVEVRERTAFVTLDHLTHPIVFGLGELAALAGGLLRLDVER